MSSDKKPCINSNSYTFSGKEKSPLGLGYTSEGYNINHIEKGKDGNMWYVNIKNNKKVWSKYNEEDFGIITTNSEVSNDASVLQNNTVKKTTNYNIFIAYRLYQIKSSLNDDDIIDNKSILSNVIEEWKNFKNNSDGLDDIMIKAKEYYSNLPIKKPTIKKKYNKKTEQNEVITKE